MNLEAMLRHPMVSLDTESTGLNIACDSAFAVGLCSPEGKSLTFDLRDLGVEVLRPLENYRGRIIAHNASFDYHMLRNAGIRLDTRCLDDTAIRAALIDEHLMSYSLDSLLQRYLGEEKVSEIYGQLAELFGGRATRKVQMANISKAPWSIVEPYLVGDTVPLMKLWQWQEEEIKRQDQEHSIALRKVVDFERSLMPMFIKQEELGIRVDLEAAFDAKAKLTDRIIELRQTIEEISPGLNVNSSKQVRELFQPTMGESRSWEIDGISIPATDKGNPSIGTDQLITIANSSRKFSKIAQTIVDLRSTIKTRDTFIGGHVLGNEINGRVHPHINQTKGEGGGTGTGRLSYTGVAMQQIPNRNKKVAAIVKPIFLPEEGHKWVDYDANSFEVRIFAHLVGQYDHNIIETYRRNPRIDFHQWVADMTNLPRNPTYGIKGNAKQLNLCVDGDTCVMTMEGPVAIREYVADFTHGIIAPIRVSTSHSIYKDWAQPIGVYAGNGVLWSIPLDNGVILKMTEDHKVPVWRQMEDGTLMGIVLRAKDIVNYDPDVTLRMVSDIDINLEGRNVESMVGPPPRILIDDITCYGRDKVYCVTTHTGYWSAVVKGYTHVTGNSAIFNSGNGSIADQMGLPWVWDEFEKDGEIIRYRKPGWEAMEIIDRYHERLPGVRTLQRKAQGIALNRGFLVTSRGRRLRFPDKRFAYKASGILIQATSADYNKDTLDILEREVHPEIGSRTLLNTHDSYSASVPTEMVPEYKEKVIAALEKEGRARVPLLYDLNGVGDNWWEAVS